MEYELASALSVLCVCSFCFGMITEAIMLCTLDPKARRSATGLFTFIADILADEEQVHDQYGHGAGDGFYG